jgi:hypothetical protein
MTARPGCPGGSKNTHFGCAASPKVCQRRVKHLEGQKKRASSVLTDHIGEAKITPERGDPNPKVGMAWGLPAKSETPQILQQKETGIPALG